MNVNSDGKKRVEFSAFTTTLLLLIIVFALFNFNFDVFNVTAAPGPIFGEGGPGFIPKWTEPVFIPPTISLVTVTEPDYCVSGPAITVSWTYSDPSSSPQQSYQVQIDNNDSFNSPEIDTGKIDSSSNSWFSGQGQLVFGERYRARVRVWNSADLASGWEPSTVCFGPGCDGASGRWRTPEQAYPQTDFIWSVDGVPGGSPAINESVDFTDQTVFSGNPGGREWDWLFGDGGSSSSQNPSHTYVTEGNYFVTLTATDDEDQPCSKVKGPLIIQKPIPEWKEVAPK